MKMPDLMVKTLKNAGVICCSLALGISLLSTAALATEPLEVETPTYDAFESGFPDRTLPWDFSEVPPITANPSLRQDIPVSIVDIDEPITATGLLNGPNISVGTSVYICSCQSSHSFTFKSWQIELIANGQPVHDGFGSVTINLPVGMLWDESRSTAGFDNKLHLYTIRINDEVVDKVAARNSAGNVIPVQLSSLPYIPESGIHITYISYSVSTDPVDEGAYAPVPAIPEQNVETPLVYRLYSPKTLEHLYTTDENEARTLSRSDWNYEGIGWTSPASGEPVYRLNSDVLQNHIYTTDLNEISELMSNHGWTMDNGGAPLFFSGGDVDIYRVYSTDPNMRGMHHLTTDANEYNTLPSIDPHWQQEGVKLKALG